jgi:hypothetical protein
MRARSHAECDLARKVAFRKKVLAYGLDRAGDIREERGEVNCETREDAGERRSRGDEGMQK